MSSRRAYFNTIIVVTCISLLTAIVTDLFLVQPLIWNRIGLQKSYNTGIAFSISLGPLQHWWITLALMLIAFTAFKQAKGTYEQIAFGFIVGGGLANMLDRLPDGQVTDMLRVGNFPIFNIADVCINIGAALLIIASVRELLLRKVK